jgi:hypothetical protein
VALNNLRAPYLSPLLIDQFGPMIAQYALPPGVQSITAEGLLYTADTGLTALPFGGAGLGWSGAMTPAPQVGVVAGAAQLLNWTTTLAGYTNSQTTLVPGNIIVFPGYDAGNNPLCDAAQITAVQIASVPGGGFTLTISLAAIASFRSLTGALVSSAGGLVGGYAVGHPMQVYGAPTALVTVVAQPGDTIALPSSVPGSGIVTLNSVTGIVDALGTDVALDSRGQRMVGPGGDVATVSGVDNVTQAISHRITTPTGFLKQHSDYGCDITYYIGGAPVSSDTLRLALITDCILQDPRIYEVTGLSIVPRDDADYVSVAATVIQGGAVVSGVVPLPGGGR